MINKKNRTKVRLAKHRKTRKNIFGTSEKPRFAVYRSNNHIYVQIIDDVKAHTLVAASSRDKDLGLTKTNNKEAARVVGESAAKKALAKGIEKVVFDRGGYVYHGKVQVLADAAREAGLKF